MEPGEGQRVNVGAVSRKRTEHLPNNETVMSGHRTEPEHEDAGGVAATADRVFYRDASEFNKAMDAAARSSRAMAGPDVAGNVIWWGVLAILAFLYLADWIFGWDLRHDLVVPVAAAP